MPRGGLHSHWFRLGLVGLAAATCVLAQTQGTAHPNASSSDPNTKAAANQVARGQKLFKYRCAICHYSESDAKKIGPGLKELFTRGKFADGKPVNEKSLTEWIENGGKMMPPFKTALTAEQIRDLIAYLKTL